jgi:hypothetical protein
MYCAEETELPYRTGFFICALGIVFLLLILNYLQYTVKKVLKIPKYDVSKQIMSN